MSSLAISLSVWFLTDAPPPMCAHLYMRGDVKEGGGGVTFAAACSLPPSSQISIPAPLYLLKTSNIGFLEPLVPSS